MRCQISVLLSLAVAACQPAEQNRTSALAGDSALVPLFVQASDDRQGPVELLAAMAYEDTRLVPVAGAPHSGAPAEIGLLGLRESGTRDLYRAAALAGLSPDLVRKDDASNVR